MRRAANFLIPITLITAYYALCVVVMWFLLIQFPAIQEFFPIGGLGDLAGRNVDSFEPIYSSAEEIVFAPSSPLRLAFASIGAAILIIPVSWIYFITSRTKEVNQSFVQTIIIMPIVVTGISTVVMNSIPLAFSLAGIVAAVRFRFTLDQPSHAMYIFVAISIGLAAGIGAPILANAGRRARGRRDYETCGQFPDPDHIDNGLLRVVRGCDVVLTHQFPGHPGVFPDRRSR